MPPSNLLQQWSSTVGYLPVELGTRSGTLAHWKSRKSDDDHRGGEPVSVYVSLQGPEQDRPELPQESIQVVIESLLGAVRTVTPWQMRAKGLRVDLHASEVTVWAERYLRMRNNPDGIVPAAIAAAVMEGPQVRNEWVTQNNPYSGSNDIVIPEYAQWVLGVEWDRADALNPFLQFYDRLGAVITVPNTDLLLFRDQYAMCIPIPGDAVSMRLNGAAGFDPWFSVVMR